ncbi:MAG TPA: Gfo/Idh/MocA family oxidoreductase [Candidatus Dormibacteraeota bacterium]|nr:Gfo/Idh/MocA family oxidoreductase [Candidatus Dormibacteraeota bacterium]
MAAPEQLRVGLIGFGLWGPHYARILSGTMTSARLAACAEPAAARLAAFDRQYPGARAYADYNRMLRDGDIDAVIVATPTSTHREVVERCLAAGVHVLVEKPLAATVQDAEALADAERGSGRVLMVGHTFLFNPAVRAIKGYIDNGLLGDIRYLYFTRTGLGPIRQDVNALWDLAPHDFSMLRYWLGADPVDLIARGQSYLKPDTEDVVFVTLTYPDKVLASVHVSWLDPVKVRSVTVVGDRKMVVFDDTHATEKLRIYDRGADYQPREGGFAEFIAAVRDGDIVIPRLEQREPLREQLEHFVECVRTGARPLASAEDGVAIVKVLERAQRELRASSHARA